MKTTLLIFMVFVLTITVSNSQQNVKLTKNVQFNGSVPDFYKQYSSFTDPGEYKYLYENLPDSLPELCSLIKSQFIHPYAELPEYREQIPEERWDESFRYPTVKSVLKGLLSYDSRGLVQDRKPEHRLVLGCREYAILLASVLKHRDIPARVRSGHALYLIPGFHASHTICEVWNEKEKRWMLVDPATGMVDFNRDEFDFSCDTWFQLQKKEIDPSIYGNPGQYTGIVSIVGKVCPDLASLLGNEYTVYQYAPILDFAFEKKDQMPAEHTELLNTICELMKSPNTDNLSKLQEIYNNNPVIQISKTIEISKETPANNMEPEKTSTNKPEIEFVDIPEGTFIIGSPATEQGRKDDEIQHEVTVSSFKMSKYTITVEQYNLFCEVTGRKKLWYGPYGQANNSVTQVTWYDAQAFAEWMGCRLPTEAEFEYAARANTKTPFYTGDCLTTDQANFIGEEPYLNCEKGINRKKPIPVGSFAPNAFGLYDMHGNMLEWVSDWYGEYIVADKLNPKGPETGSIKVARGGGWSGPAGECRSACRGGGIPPVNRGAGISFRIVKDE